MAGLKLKHVAAFQRQLCALLLFCVAPALGRAVVVYTWVGDFPNDRIDTPSDWRGGAAPPEDGSAVLVFTDSSASDLRLDVAANVYGISLNGVQGDGVTLRIGGSSGMTIGGGGITVLATEGGGGLLHFGSGSTLTLSASQTWSINDDFGTIDVEGSIGEQGGSAQLTLYGSSQASFVLNSGASTFSGGVILSGSSTLTLGASSSGAAGAVSSGPVGTGTLSLGDGTTLATSAPVTLANAVVFGDGSNSAPIALGSGSSGGNRSGPSLTLAGPVTVNDSDLEIDLAGNTVVLFSGPINGAAANYCLDFGTTESAGESLVILSGPITNISRIDLEDSAQVIFDGGLSQLSGLTDAIGTGSSTYLGIGSSFSGNVAVFLAHVSAQSFTGTLGFDTTSGPRATFSDPIDLTSFTNTNFFGLGSATSAILTGLITPPGGFAQSSTYAFGGGGGLLQVKSGLTDSGNGPNNLTLGGADAPLTLVLSGPLSYTGPTHVDGAALIFDTPPPTGGIFVGVNSPQAGYVGSTLNSGITDADPQAFLSLIDPTSFGVVGFDAQGSARTVTGPIDLSGFPSLYLGTASSVTYSGAITPANNAYGFAGVKGGQVTVASTLTGSTSVAVVGLPIPIESFGSQSSVTFSGANTYGGGTWLQSGFLYVTSGNSLGTGPLTVVEPAYGPGGWVATLGASGGPVSLPASVSVSLPQDGLALNSGSSQTLTINGVISDGTIAGRLGIFGPVDLEGQNTYSGGTQVGIGSNTTVTLGSDHALGEGPLTANGAGATSVLNFTSAAPALGSSVSLDSITANFAGSPVLQDLSLAEATLNFNGPTAAIEGLQDDQANSTNVINIASGELTVNADEEGGGGATYHGLIEGAGALVVAGGGPLNLAGANTYTGGTTIDSNSVLIASVSGALGTGPVTVYGGLGTNKGVTVSNSITLEPGGGLAGFGTFSPGGTLDFFAGTILDPGRALIDTGQGPSGIPVQGSLAFGGGTALTLGPGGVFIFSLANAGGSAGGGYGTLNLSGGALSVTAVPTEPFFISLYPVNPTTNSLGTANFNPAQAYQWTLISNAGSISGFNAGLFAVDTATYFTTYNSVGSGQFFVSADANDIYLNFTPVPEPSTWALLAGGLGFLGAALRRRRR